MLTLLTNLPKTVKAEAVAQEYRRRWTIEAAFGELTLSLRGEINTLGYPGAALLGYRPIDCVVVEDAPSGAAAGAAAGSPVLGVLGTHRAEELNACTWVVDSLERLVVTPKANRLELEFTPVIGAI